MNRINKKEKEKENVVDSYKEFCYIYIYIYKYFKCHQLKNYKINGDIYCFLEQIEIIKLLEIYIVSWDRFILITS